MPTPLFTTMESPAFRISSCCLGSNNSGRSNRTKVIWEIQGWSSWFKIKGFSDSLGLWSLLNHTATHSPPWRLGSEITAYRCLRFPPGDPKRKAVPGWKIFTSQGNGSQIHDGPDRPRFFESDRGIYRRRSGFLWDQSVGLHPVACSIRGNIPCCGPS